MGVRAYGRETLASLPIDVDKNWNDRSISNVNSLQVNEHITLLARGKKRNVYPTLNRYDSETDGWYISKDNGDIERKFWKDDFSVDSSSQYTGDVAYFTWDTANKRLICPNTFANKYKQITINKTLDPTGFKAEWILSFDGDGAVQTAFFFKIGTKTYRVYPLRHAGMESTTHIYLRNDTDGFAVCYSPSIDYSGTNSHRLGVVYNGGTTITLLVDGLTYSGTITPGLVSNFQFKGLVETATNVTPYISDLSILPSVSYSDDFSTNTTERYQPVLGTVAYDNTNKRMNVTTATGANGKASGRLKSYKFCEGSQIYDVLLPTGADGDFICMVTHATDPAMTDGIGVGLQSDGAGNWNLVTLSGTTVTEGADSGLDDGDVARIEIEKDDKGCYWYYIYDASGVKPTTPTGKLFTTLTEGYTGWYANGNSKTYAIDNISIRAESIVGRTNVEVTEPFWFRDEFGENSIGRYSGITSSYTVTGGKLTCVTEGRFVTVPCAKLKDPTVSFTWKPTSKDVNGRYRSIIVFRGSMTSTADVFTSSTPDIRKIVYIVPDQNSVYLYTGIPNTAASICDGQALTVTYNEEHTITVTKTGTTYILNVDGTEVTLVDNYGDPDLESSYISIGVYNCGTTPHEIDNLQISGTRVYQKPIHRGAMLESYHDGTQEVVGTTFIDDCQWNRLSEYTTNADFTHNSLTGEYNLLIPIGARYAIYPKNLGKLGNGSYSFTIKSNTTTVRKLGIQLFRKEQVSYNPYRTGTGYYLEITNNNMTIELTKIINDVRVTVPGGTTLNINTLTPRRIRLDIDGITLKVYVDGILRTTFTLDPTILPGFFGFGTDWDTAAEVLWSISDIQIIAASSDATNGIAACIPPIGGGARYGEQEKVYKQLVNAAKFGEYKTTALVKTTNAGAEAIEMYFKNITDTTNIATDDTDTLAISLADTNYSMLTKDLQLLPRDRADTIEVAVRKTAAATEVSPTCYVTDLMILPKMEG